MTGKGNSDDRFNFNVQTKPTSERVTVGPAVENYPVKTLFGGLSFLAEVYKSARTMAAPWCLGERSIKTDKVV